ncbi:MAG: sigma-70 family RNA polymerase sigma factor [Ruminococcus sp.]|nr:sigma-70 family RNA polymerase sigma factor [Ruminococcus sp.]
MTDTEWSSLINSSPRQAFEQLADSYGGYVYTIVVSKLGSLTGREDIEDCVSDIFVEVYSSLRKYSSSQGSLKSFISSIAQRRAIDAFRKLSRRYSVSVSSDDEDTELPPSGNDTAEEAENAILRKKLWASVDALDEPDRTIILYQYFYRMDCAEIARKLDMSPAAVRKRSQRARKKLKATLDNEL